MMLFVLLLTCSFKLKLSYPVYYTDLNSTDIFNYFKEKYSKVYKDEEDEKSHLKTFITNLNIVNKLNDNTTDKNTFFIVNQHADLNPMEIEEKYAISIKPYYKVGGTENAEYVGRQRENDLKPSNLYNLDNAEDLYKDFMKKFKKINSTKKVDRTIHFYRFVKTLVELNKNKFEDNGLLELDENADIVKNPNEYFY